MPQHMPSRLRVPGHFASQMQSVRAYFCQTMNVKACGVWTTHATAYTFRMTSARAFCLPDTECQGIFLTDYECAGICLLETVRQGISIDGYHRIYFRTALASALTAPNLCWPCVCVLDKDGRRSSPLDDDCQSDAFSFCRRVSSMWCLDDTRHSMCFSDDKCQGMWRPIDTRHSKYLLDDKCQGILPSRRRVSGHISFRQ